MVAQAPDRKQHPVVWVLAGILCLCTLTAMWVTAARIKADKMAARYGVPIPPEPAVADPKPSPIRLKRGESAPAQHLTLAYVDGSLEVRNAQGRALARYPDLKPGRRLGWQELRVEIREASADEVLLDAEFVPGAASFGPGIYLDLRAGLRVEFAKGRSLTVLAWDPVKLEGKVRFERGDRSEERPLTAPVELFDLRCALMQNPGAQLFLEDLD